MAHLSRSTQVDFVDFGPSCAEAKLWRVATSILPHKRRSDGIAILSDTNRRFLHFGLISALLTSV